MTWTTFMDVDLNCLSEACKWWTTYNSNSAVTAPPELVGDAFAKVQFAARNAVVPAQTAYRSKDAMDLDLIPAAGIVANCFDPDETKRGRYVKSGASGSGCWTLQGLVADKAWNDPNHVGRLLELIWCSWIEAEGGAHDGSNGKNGWSAPPGNDWSNVRITMNMRATGLYLGPWAKICQHIQGEIPALSSLLAPGKYAMPNYIFTKDLISDQLGFAQPGSWGKPNVVPFVQDSGWVDVVLNYTADESAWECLGRYDKALGASAFHYVAAPVASILTNLVGNSYMMAVHPFPQTGDAYWSAVTGPILERDRIRGSLLMRSIKAEYFTP